MKLLFGHTLNGDGVYWRHRRSSTIPLNGILIGIVDQANTQVTENHKINCLQESIIYVTGSDILSLMEVQHWHHKTWDESDIIKFARNFNWVSAHWLNSFKASPEEYDAAFLMASFTFFICTLSEFFHILDQWKEMPLTRVMKIYPTCMLFIPINGNEDGKSGWCEFCYFSQ